MNNKFDLIIVAAGSGKRLGSTVPKAFVPLNGKPLFFHSLEIFSSHALLNDIILVVPESMIEESRMICSSVEFGGHLTITHGGAERWESVNNGVSLAKSDWVLVHDAARPFVTHTVIDNLLAKRESYECAITAIPVVDTIRTFESDKAGETIDRSKLVRVGTPQLFKRESLIRALAYGSKMIPPPTDEAMLMQQQGHDVGIAWGDPNNFKVTTSEDLELAEALCERRR